MPRLYDAETADSAWLAVRNDFVNGNCNQQTSRLGPTLEISQTCVTLHDPLQRWITVRKPAISPAFAIVEVIWILSGRN
jgi:thymidylate synthase